MRVHVTIPGTVDSYCIDERGDKRVASDELWLETYLCSVLRAYSYADDGSGETIRKIMGVRRFNPVTNTETEHRFLQAAELLFFRGIICEDNPIGFAYTWQVGSWALIRSFKSQTTSPTISHLAFSDTSTQLVDLPLESTFSKNCARETSKSLLS
jgi:hypothetical protein